MNKIKNYILILSLSIISAFVLNSKTIFAEEIEEEPIEEVDPTKDYIIINPNSIGEPQYVFNTSKPGDGGTQVIESKQYTKSRDVFFLINMPETELLKYEEEYSVCETIVSSTSSTERCAKYLLGEEGSFQISSKNDGEKRLKFTFKGVKSDANNNYKDMELTRTIILDTIGPVIELEGGEYMFIPLGKKYEEKGATCADDSGVLLGECKVQYEEANINMNSTEYQYVRYTAKDFLGNETNVVRKILVEIAPPEEKKDYTYWIISGAGVAILSALLFLQVWKNKEKQKNQSVL